MGFTGCTFRFSKISAYFHAMNIINARQMHAFLKNLYPVRLNSENYPHNINHTSPFYISLFSNRSSLALHVLRV